MYYDFDDLFFSKAVTLQYEKKYKDAIDLYKEIVYINPNNVKALNNLGVALDDIGEYEEAILTLKKAIKIRPQYFDAYYNMAFIQKGIGQIDKAIENYSIAISINSSSCQSYENRGDLYFLINQKEKALQDFYRAIEIKFPFYNPEKLVYIINQNQTKEIKNILIILKKSGFLLRFKNNNFDNDIIIIPGTSENRIILSIDKIHIGKTIQRNIRKNNYDLRFNTDYDLNFDRLKTRYNKPEDIISLTLLQKQLAIIKRVNGDSSLKSVGVSLYENDELVAGEIGVLNKYIYHSYTGYHEKNGRGSAQIYLLSLFLAEKGVKYYDLGPSTCTWDPYKLKLGAEIIEHTKCIKLFNKTNNYYNKDLLKEVKYGKQH